MAGHSESDEFRALVERQRYWVGVVTVLAAVAAAMLLGMLLALVWLPRSLVLIGGVPALALCVVGIGWAHRRSIGYQARALDCLERSQQAVNASLQRVMGPLAQLQDRLKPEPPS